MLSVRMQPCPRLMTQSQRRRPAAFRDFGGAYAMSSALTSAQEESLIPKLDALEEIRALGGDSGISVPGIVVAGNQSVGKSSVIESLCGISLPRGATMTTRVPLVLRVASDASLDKPYAVIGKEADLSGKKHIDLADVGAAIERLTAELMDGSDAVRDTPIHLKVMQQNGPSMTLIDLPGITWERDGVDIHEETTYIVPEDMIVLVVMPATEDFNNVEAIKLAREVDKNGKRTLGVVTKSDTCMPDTDLLSKLRMTGEGVVKLKLGFVAVRNRTAAESDAGLSTEELRRKEDAFFSTFSPLAGIESHLWGTHTLAGRIVALQSAKVDEFIPRARKQLMDGISEAKLAVEKLPPLLDSALDRRILVCEAVALALLQFDALTGSACAREKDPKLRLGVRVRKLYDKFSADLRGAAPDLLSESSHSSIMGKMEDSRTGLTVFLNEELFQRLFEEAMEEPMQRLSEALVMDARSSVQEVLLMLLNKALLVHPKLLHELEEEVKEVMDEVESSLRVLVVDKLVASQRYLYTENHYLAQTIEKLEEATRRRPDSDEDDDDDEGDDDDAGEVAIDGLPADFIQRVLDSSNNSYAAYKLQVSLHTYLKVVQKRFGDMVPTVVQHALITEASAVIRYRLSRIPDDRLAACLAETERVTAQRADVKQRLSNLQEALSVLNRVR